MIGYPDFVGDGGMPYDILHVVMPIGDVGRTSTHVAEQSSTVGDVNRVSIELVHSEAMSAMKICVETGGNQGPNPRAVVICLDGLWI